MSQGIYVHLPFCRRKCLYCDFYSVGERLADWSRLARAIVAEFKMRSNEISTDDEFTIYFGGGTPSLMPTDLIAMILQEIKKTILQKNPRAEFPEITIEVNPDDVTDENARAWHSAGFNRVSMGVQSLDDELLRFIGRRHSAEQAVDAYCILRKYFSNISLDLMFGLPGQTIESLRRTLEGFTKMLPEHISAYSLMYEERTALTRMRDAGKIKEIEEESSVDMFQLISDTLRDAGYERYEISNYCRPGFESRHNFAYWQAKPYIGLGPSAHSYDGASRRRANIPDVSQYIEGVETARDYYEIEHLTDEDLREEMIMTRLRTSKGLSLEEYGTRFGLESLEELLQNAKRNIRLGNLENADGALRLTDSGVMLSDDVISDLF